MKNRINFLTLAIVVCLNLNGCSFSKESSDSAKSNPEKNLPALSPSMGEGWISESDSNGDLADLTINRMTPAEREKVRSEVSRNNVTWINSKTGYSLYKIEGSVRFEKNAFILPKILVIGSVDGGRASLRDLPDGRVSLTIPVALIDGSQKELPYSTTRIRIPDGLYLNENKRETIQKELQDTFGYPHELSSLGSCPKKIVIKISGVESDVTPRVFGDPSGPTGCQPNQPFTITLQGSRKTIERFLSDDVFNGSAEIAALYEVAGTYVDEIRLYQIKTEKIYSKLKERLSLKKELLTDEVDQILGSYVQEALSKWAAKERFFDRIKNTAIAQMKLVFFDERLPEKINDKLEDKLNNKKTIFVLKNEPDFKPINIPIRILNESLGRQGELFYSSSIIKPILNSTNVAIRGEERQDLSLPPTSGIAQDVFTVKEGEEYELQLTSLIIHEYEFEDEQAQPKIQDKGLVCLDKPGEALPACRKYINECIEFKNFCKLPKTGCIKFGTKLSCDTKFNATPLGCLTLGIFGGCNISRECIPVTDKDVCLEYGSVGCEDWGKYCSDTHQICEPGQEEPLCKNQISDLRISRYFSAPAPVNNQIVNAPLGNTDQDILGGLTFRFRWPDGKTVDCLALALLKEVTGQSIRFKMKNNNSCKPFPEGYPKDYKIEPVLSIVNKVSTERKNIPCGIMNFSTIEGTKFYGCNGYNAVNLTPDLYKPGEKPEVSSFSRTQLYMTYFPVVDVNGVLISRSSAFTTGDTHEDEWNQ